MRRRYLVILAGIILTFAILSGCGANRTVRQPQTSDDGGAQTEEELQAEIDALQKEIDDLKSGQQDTGTTADDGNSTDGSQKSSGDSAGDSAGSTGTTISLEEAQNIALERVPGATARDLSIELEQDDGWYTYEGDIEYNGVEYEFEIDANTGNILKWEEERW